MIVAQRKTIPDLLAIVEKHRKVLVLGCGTCVTVCLAGGQREVSIIASALRMAAKLKGLPLEVGEATIERQCDNVFLEQAADAIKTHDAVLSLGCGAGVDCDDTDPLSTNECRGCSAPDTGCACDDSVTELPCYLDPVDVDGSAMCLQGTRFCRDKAWTACLELSAFRLPGTLNGGTAAALVTGPVACNPCNPSCYSTTDTPGPADVGTGGVVYTPAPGGLTLPATVGMVGLPDTDGDGVTDLIEISACPVGDATCAADAITPTSSPRTRGDFVFLEPFLAPPDPLRDTLSFATDLRMQVTHGIDGAEIEILAKNKGAADGFEIFPMRSG